MTTYRINRSVVVTATRTGRMDLHGLSLEVVPEDLFSPQLCDSLTSLDLSGNHISSLPPALTSLHKLRELLLDDNALRSLPAFLCSMPALKAISLDGNKLDAELMRAHNRAKTVNTGSGRGREVAPVLQWLLAHGEKDTKQQLSVETAPTEPLSAVSATSSSATSSATSSPAVSRPSSADSTDSGAASRFKQASLSSDLFSSAPPSAPASGRRLHSASHQSSDVFAHASQPYDGHTGKKVHSSTQGNAASAPFGTDHQAPEPSRPRRVVRDEGEKENELSSTVRSSPYAHVPQSSTKGDSTPHGTGKRMQRDQPQSQSPFATLATNPVNHFQSSSAAASQSVQTEMDRLADSGASTPTAGSARAAVDGNTMSAALSHLQLDRDGQADAQHSQQRRGIRIVDKAATDIFGVSSAAPTDRSGVAKVKPHPSAESKSDDGGFGSGVYVQRGGRARVNHGQKDTALW
jgi:hypothetical protein